MTDIVSPIPTGGGQFAAANDVAIRLGRDLTGTELETVDLLLTIASATIANAADKTDEWAAALDPVPVIIKGFCIELTCRALANPEGLFSQSKTLGAYSHSKSFNKEASSAMALTEVETLVIRRALLGRNSGSARAESLLDLPAEEEPAL